MGEGLGEAGVWANVGEFVNAKTKAVNAAHINIVREADD
jgi:hypothetical protein